MFLHVVWNVFVFENLALRWSTIDLLARFQDRALWRDELRQVSLNDCPLKNVFERFHLFLDLIECLRSGFAHFIERIESCHRGVELFISDCGCVAHISVLQCRCLFFFVKFVASLKKKNK